MPPDRHRTTNPQGRQKSCSECAKAKRRCDLQQPDCIRCTRQKLTCIYPLHPYASAAVTLASPAESPIATSHVDESEVRFSIGSNDFIAPDMDFLDFDFSTLNPIGSRNVQAPEERTIIDLPSPDSTPSITSKFSTFILSPFAQTRIGYSFEQMKQSPRMFLETNSTHWSHPKLYSEYMPRSLQDAYAACALYVARNDVNASFIARHITERAAELVVQPLPTPPIELLARAQSLLLYQIILVCSEDIRFFCQAEHLVPHIRDIANSILDIATRDDDPVGTIPVYPSINARNAWSSFIFRESCRRTLLMVFHAIALFNLMAGRLESCSSHTAVGNRITISATLWNAPSSFDFAIAWNQMKHFLVKDLDFKDLLRNAEADDVDIFGCMMLIGLMGIDDVKGWLHTRGGELQMIAQEVNN